MSEDNRLAVKSICLDKYNQHNTLYPTSNEEGDHEDEEEEQLDGGGRLGMHESSAKISVSRL